MQIKLLNDILSNIVGRQASDIVNLLVGKKNVNEFIIAKKLKLTINQVRNILYKLSDAGLVSFTRKKDKRKGWYTYFWTLNIEKSLELLATNIKKEVDGLRNQRRNRETRRFYFCNTCKTEVNEETALLNNFTCLECGEVYSLQTDQKIIQDLTAKIKRLDSVLESISVEIEKIHEKESKKQAREEKKAAKKTKKKVKKAKKAGKKAKKTNKRTKKKGSKKAKKNKNKKKRL